MTFVKLELRNKTLWRTQNLDFLDSQAITKNSMSIKKGDRAYGSKRKTLVKISQQTGIRECNTVLKHL